MIEKSLINRVLNAASLQKLQSLEEAYDGSPFALNNRVSDYRGLSSKGYPIVNADGKTYNVLSTSGRVPNVGQRVILRAGKGIVRISY